MSAPLQPELLLRHGRFVRLLAFHLLRDAHAAEDVAQECWLRALEHPPLDEGRLRPWLRRVVSNLARNRQRATGNRTTREVRAARSEALPSLTEELERAELLREVVDAVLALDEPYRTTVLCRYFRGWDAPRLARETDTPLATVRSREQRALEQLRGMLDRRLAGGHAAWALALGKVLDLPRNGVPPPASSAGPVLALKLGLLSAAAIGALIVVRAVPTGSVATAPQGSPPHAAALALEPVVPRGLPMAPPEATLAEPPVSTHPARVPGVTSALLRAGTCEIRGRFLLPGGAPAAGVSVELEGWACNDQRLADFGEPEGWQDPRVETDEGGRFALVFAPPRAYCFELEAKLPGFAREKRDFYELFAGDLEDLGEVELLLGGAIEGRLLDAEGAPIRGERIEVLADGQTANLNHAPPARAATWEYAPVDPETGSFRLVDLSPGRVHLCALRRRNAWLDGPRVVVEAGRTVHQDLVYRGPDLDRRITLSLSTRVFHPLRPGPEAVRLSGPGIEARPPATDPPRNHLVFDDLAPGEYSLAIDDPRFRPWSRTGITPGSEVRAELVGSSTLVLDVRDGEGNALPLFTVDATIRNVNFLPTGFRMHAGTAPLAGGRLEGLVAGDYTIAASVAGLGTRALEVEGLLPGETRALSLSFGPPTLLAGHVRRPDGAPVADVEVLLLAPAAVDDSPRSAVVPRNGFMSDSERARHERARTRTDEGGAFRFGLPMGGTFALCTFRGAMQTASESWSVAEGGRREDVELVLPAGGRIQGRLTPAPGDSCPGLRVRAVEWPDPALGLLDSERHEAVLAADGSFELGPFPAGEAKLVLLLPEAFLSGWGQCGERISGGVRLAAVALSEGAVTEADLGLVSGLPGDVSVAVLVDGAPAAGVKVALLELVEGMELEHARTLSDSAGQARLPVFPGTYRLLVEDADAGWSHVDAAPLVVAARQSRSAVVAIELVAGELTLLDASSGAPLANEWLALEAALGSGWHRSFCRLRADGNGHLALRLPAGEYRLARAERPAAGVVTWTTSGPLPARLEL